MHSLYSGKSTVFWFIFPSKLQFIVVSTIQEDLNFDLCASLPLRNITALLDSPLWQLQLEGLFLLRILLRNRNSEMIPIKDTTISEVRPQPLEKSSMGVSARQNGSSLTYSTASKKALSTSVKSSRQDSLRINKSTKNKGRYYININDDSI